MPAIRPSDLLARPSICIPSQPSASSRLGRGASGFFVSAIVTLEQVLGGAGGIDLPLDNAVEELTNRFIVRDSRLQTPPHPGSCQLQYLVAEVPGPPLLQGALGLDVFPVLGDLLGQLGHALALRRLGLDDRDPPRRGGAER